MKKHFGILLALTMISITMYSQTSMVNHWESVFYSDAKFKYWSSSQGNADQNWRKTNFDDSAWPEGKGGIGYGDGDDSTIIAACVSVSLRISFTLPDKSKFAEAQLYIDYDDAFVAYLNGTEIARSAGLTDSFPASNKASTADHEAGTKVKYTIDPIKLAATLVNGKNTIAIQVHNTSSISSDLSSSVWFCAGLTTASNIFMPIPDWFETLTPTTFNSSNLPILVIKTDNAKTIPDEPKIAAHLDIISNNTGVLNYLTDKPSEYSGYIGIECRGNSTQGFPKKPYDFETRDSLGANLNVSLFGWPADNDWLLLANYLDHTFVRNALATHMSRAMGRWASRCKLVEVVVNDQYVGIYGFMEKIKVGKGRLNISKLNITEITEPSISGGYIYEISGFANTLGESRHLRYPEFETAAPEQIKYITQYDNNFRSVMKSDDYTDEVSGYNAWIDASSFVDELLVQEAMRNGDAYGWSGYFHKNKNGKINAGPVWDFDQSSGNSSYPDDGVIDGWLVTHPSTNNTPFFWPLLFEDPIFKYKAHQRWESLRKDTLSTKNLLGFIDSIANLLSQPQKREFVKWPVLGKYIMRETQGYQERDTYQKEIDYLKDFLTKRWDWMDTTLAKVKNPNPVIPISISNVTIKDILVYPNPVKSYISVDITSTKIASVSISIYNSLGVLVKTTPMYALNNGNNSFTLDLSKNFKPGVYLYKMHVNNIESYVGKFIKVE